MNQPRIQRYLWFSVLILFGLGVRLLGLTLQPLWWDEGYSLYFATESLPRLIDLTSRDIHPPLYYLLLQGWFNLVGVGAVQARLLSVLIGVVTLPVAWWAARLLAGRRVAWIATLLLALSPFHIYYSQEVRMYGLMLLLALLAVVAWQRRRWYLLALFLVGGLLTHYYFALLALAITLLILLDLREKMYGPEGPLRALGLLIVCYLPWLLYAGPRLVDYVSSKVVIEGDEPMTWQFLPRHIVAWSLGHPSPGWEWIGWLAPLFLLLAFLGLLAPSIGQYRWKLKLLLLWAIPTLGTFLIGLRAPFDDPRIERQLLFVLPFFLMMVAQGIGALWRRWSLAVAPLVLLLLLAQVIALWPFYTLPRYPEEDYRPLLRRVGAKQGPEDGWLAIYPWQVGYLRAYLPDRHPAPLVAKLEWEEDDAARARAIRSLLEAHPRLWLPAYQVKGRILEAQLVQTLRAEGVEVWNDWYGNSRLYLFAHAPELPPLRSVGQFDGAGEARATLAAERVTSGVGVLPFFLEVENVSEGLRASVQLVGRGSVWGEWDGEVGEGTLRAGLPVSHGTPPGQYGVQLTLYREDGALLDRFEGGVRHRPEAMLGTVAVERPAPPLPARAIQFDALTSAELLLGERVHFLGSSVLDRQARQGERVPITLFWQAERAPLVPLQLFIQAVNEAGEVRAAWEGAPVNGSFPTSEWQAGDLVRDPHEFLLPADLPAGTYRLIAGLYEPGSGARLATPGGQDWVDLGPLQVEARDRMMEEPRVGEPVEVPFGERAVLARRELPVELKTGEPMEATLVWRARATGGAPLRVFVQLYRGGEQLLSSDHPLEPPATAWIEGEWIVDRHLLGALDALPPGDYSLVTGLYDPATQARLPTPEGEWATIARWSIEE